MTIEDTPIIPDFDTSGLPDWFDGFRDQQAETIQSILDCYAEGAKVVILDAPTGSGKTLIAEAVRQQLKPDSDTHSYTVPGNYTCSTKSLQDQFLEDFPYSRVLKGKANYPTQHYPDRFYAKGFGQLSCEDCTGKSCKYCDVCPYQVAKNEAKYAPIAVLNSAYLLREWQSPNSNFSGRGYTVFDECDTLEQSLLSVVEIYISEYRQRAIGLEKPDRKTVQESWQTWVEYAIPKVSTYLGQLEGSSLKVRKERSTTNRLLKLLRTMYADMDNWVFTGYEKQLTNFRGPIQFKPVEVSHYGRQFIWDAAVPDMKFLLMSASVISPGVMADELGLESDEWASVNMDSTFPPDRRPIYAAPVANVTGKSGDKEFNDLSVAVDNILNASPGRALIHTVSYKLARELQQRTMTNKRVLTYRDSGERQSAIEKFHATEDCAMFAPSLDRGIDLPYDLCETQIIAKVPFLYLGDKQISARMHSPGGGNWYTVHTIRTIVQMSGRGMRSADDYCTTYILDSQFTTNLYKRSTNLFPQWWRDAVEIKGNWGNTLKRKGQW